MILVLILLGIIVLVITVLILIIFSSLNIKIKNLSISNMETKSVDLLRKKSKSKYEVEFSLYLFGKLKWIWFNLNDKKAKKIYSKMQLEKIDYKKFKKDFKLKDIKQLPKLQPKILYLNLEAEIGVESPVITSFLVSSIASLISITLPYLVRKIEKDKYIYNIKPLYYNKNLYKINLNCIIQIKMVHIINIIYVLSRKGRKKNEQSTTSNRKPYAYSYE